MTETTASIPIEPMEGTDKADHSSASGSASVSDRCVLVCINL
jgi:hypothetical protein